MKFLHDEYTLNIDDLGYKQQADVIRDLIINAETPFSIGVSGRWGSGKTSMMKYLMASLGGEPLQHRLDGQTKIIKEQNNFLSVKKDYEDKKDCEFIHCIWFNPWEHENNEEPFVELLKEIKNYFSMLLTLRDKSAKIVSVSIQAGLDMLGSYLNLGRNQATNIKNIGEKYEYDNFEYTSRNQRFKLIFQETLEKLLTTKKNGKDLVENSARIVIFIDDLDRCEDDTIAKLLKEIKQYLSTKRCVFVFGYDRHHIERSLSKSVTKTNKETRAYLEKLFQTTFYIKEPSGDNLKSFVKDILKQYKLDDSDDLTNFIISIIDPNPRRLKSFLTAFYFHIKNSSFAENENIELENLKKLALIAYLKLFYESVYTALENQPKLLKDLIVIFQNRNIFDTTNQREYYLHLEFKSHIHDIDITKYSDKIELKKEFEEKFLNEVYEMQGKHRSFENYMSEFVSIFIPKNEKTSTNINENNNSSENQKIKEEQDKKLEQAVQNIRKYL